MRTVGVLVVLSALLFACGAPATDKEMWSKDWSEPTSDVMVALAKAHVQGCGEFYQKENAKFSGDFAVACNRMPDESGKPAWVGYEVWPSIDKIQGPDMTAVWMHFGGPPRSDPR